ncbi:MAG: glycosyltransferase [Phycisphaerae bacterium]
MAKPLRVLLVISDLSGGGAERQFSLLVQHLSPSKCELHLCVWRRKLTYRLPDGLPIHIVEKTRAWHAARAMRGLRRLIEDLNPAVVFSTLHYVNMVTGSALAGARCQPAWVCRQCSDPRRDMKGPFLLWARRALRRANRVVGISHGVSRAVVDYLHVDRERVHTIYNGVDVAQIDRLAGEPLPFRRDPRVFTVVHAGRLSREKNQSMLLDAFARFRGRRAELWMLGQGRLGSRLRARARRLRISEQVKWIGFDRNPFRFFRQADCLALSSDWEGLSNVIIEAMVCGTPVVSTNCRYGPGELIENGTTGWLTPVGDAGCFADALEHLFDNRAAARRLGAAARDRNVTRFGIMRACRDYETLFETVSNRQGSDGGID